jgi:hypothetical protein
MRKQLATALILGVGLVPEVRAGSNGRDRAPQVTAPWSHHRAFAPLVARRTHFDHMRSAGKIKRHQIATFSYDDGRLWADWTAPLHVPQPMRVETEELDAEWMALAPQASTSTGIDSGWLLARRDLQPQDDDRFWFVRLYGTYNDPGRIDLLATSELADPNYRKAITFTYSQSAEGVRLRTNASPRIAFDLQASNLRQLIQEYPTETRGYLIPALGRITKLNDETFSA